MDIYFIRHGDPDYSTDSLTELGKQQAAILAEAIKDYKFDEIYQSSMGRAQETASYSLKKWNRTAETLDWTRELEWGDMSGDAYASESPWVLKDYFIQNEHSYPAGEQWRNHPKFQQDRLIQDLDDRYAHFDEFLKQNGYVHEGQVYNATEPNSKKIAVFCHGGLTSALIAHAINIPFLQFISHTAIRVTAISKLHFSEQKGYTTAQLVYFNDYNHLEKIK